MIAMPPIVYRLHTKEQDGTEWTCPTAGTGPDLAYVANVLALCYSRVLRWATEEGTGRFLYGYDQLGREIARSPYSAVPSFLGDEGRTPVYPPAVRIYAPSPDLQLRAVRGMGAVVLAYQDGECRGWVEVGDIGYPSARAAMDAGRVAP